MKRRLSHLFSNQSPPSVGFSERSDRSQATRVKLLVRPRRRNPWWRIGNWLLIGGTATLAGFVIWSGIRLIINPYDANWLKAVLPNLSPLEAAPIRTLEEIQAEVQSRDLIAGAPVLWYADKQDTHSNADWIFPVQKTRSQCQLSCTSITELQIYRPLKTVGQTQHYQLLQQIKLQGPKESFITTPLIGTASEVASVDQAAPLTRLKLLDNPLDDHPWLLVEGQKFFGNTEIRYGRVLHYDPHTTELHTLATWTSPAGKSPTFQNLDDPSQAELLIDQTVGLEPQFQIYQLVNTNPPQLKEVSLLRSAYNQPMGTSLYQKALQLARNGVWSHAQQMMQSARSALGKEWSPEAEAQLRLIEAHARVTKSQAERTWSSQSQQVQAYLIDGEWEAALKTLETHPGLYGTVTPLLQRNFERLWKRVQAHLQVHSQDPAAQIWGALLITARQNLPEGQSWLKERSKDSTALQARLAAAMKPPPSVAIATADHTSLATTSPPTATPATAATTVVSTSAVYYQRLLGTAQVLTAPGSNWNIRSETLPTPAAEQVWYQVDVLNLYNGNRWDSISNANVSGITRSADSLWQWAGLQDQDQLQLITWDPGGQTIPNNLKILGVRRQNSRLELLGLGPALPSLGDRPPLAITPSALQWISPDVGQPLNLLLRTNSLWNERLPRQLEQLLGFQRAARINPTLVASYPYWQTYYLDITGDSTPELFLTLDPAKIPADLSEKLVIDHTQGTRTLIFTGGGGLLYSDLTNPKSIIALAPGSPALATAILTYQDSRYSLQYVGR